MLIVFSANKTDDITEIYPPPLTSLYLFIYMSLCLSHYVWLKLESYLGKDYNEVSHYEHNLHTSCEGSFDEVS